MAHENNVAAIRQLQRYLRTLHYFDNAGGRVPLDGIFDDATEAALRAFQEAAGLSVTGRADLETWERLFAAYSASVEAKRPPERIAHFPQIPENYSIEVGETQFLVSIIQNALQELAIIYEGLEAVPLSGIYDEATAAAVRAFQKIHGLPATGAVDRATWNAIAIAYNRNFSDPYLRQ